MLRSGFGHSPLKASLAHIPHLRGHEDLAKLLVDFYIYQELTKYGRKKSSTKL
jgi:hypothetical protein